MSRHSSLPYVLPFLSFLAMLALLPHLGLGTRTSLVLFLVVPAAVLAAISRGVLDFRIQSPWLSVAVGVFVFAVWVGPDVLISGWRSHWIFQNELFGKLTLRAAPELVRDPVNLLLRFARAAVLVPIVEELFWRSWLMRWLIRHDFWEVPLGTFIAKSFWITAILFAVEHGPYWEVGLLAGIIYNGYMVRVKSLGDLILAHAVTNACLSAFVLATGRWEFWM